jgi:hypothetical protein
MRIEFQIFGFSRLNGFNSFDLVFLSDEVIEKLLADGFFEQVYLLLLGF